MSVLFLNGQGLALTGQSIFVNLNGISRTSSWEWSVVPTFTFVPFFS